MARGSGEDSGREDAGGYGVALVPVFRAQGGNAVFPQRLRCHVIND